MLFFYIRLDFIMKELLIGRSNSITNEQRYVGHLVLKGKINFKKIIIKFRFIFHQTKVDTLKKSCKKQYSR
jgi:hypothetical protein